MSVRISTHAIERYVQRIDPSASWECARAVLLETISTASRLKEKSYAGDTIFAAPTMRLVVAEENGHREVLTVLEPSCEKREALPALAEQLAAEFAEWEKTQEIHRSYLPLEDDEEPTPAHFSGSPEIRRLAAGITRRQRLISILLGQLNEKPRPQKPAPTPNANLAHELHQAKAQLGAAERRLAVQVAHAKRMDEERERWKKQYGAVLALLLVGDSAGALAEAETQNSNFVEFIRCNLHALANER